MIKAKNKLSRNQIKHQEKAVVVKDARKALEEAKLMKEAVIWRQGDLKLPVKGLLA